MAMRPIDGNELADMLNQIVSDYRSHGMYPAAFPIEYAIEIVEKMPTLTQPNEWISVKERLPQNGDEAVLCIVSGKPADNITLYNAYELGRYVDGDGWIIDEWPEWEDAKVLWWTPLPAPPEGLEEEQCGLQSTY